MNSSNLKSNTSVVEGHTDSIGSPSYNKELSEGRAESAMSYLIENGVDRDRLKSIGYGEENPLNGVATNDARQRRVEKFKVDIW